MKPEDVYESHSLLFGKIRDAMRDDYKLIPTVTNHQNAIQMLMDGMLPEEFIP